MADCFLDAKSVSISSRADFLPVGGEDDFVDCLVYVFGPEAGDLDLFFGLLIVMYLVTLWVYSNSLI